MLDVGCGSGIDSIELGERNNFVVSVDLTIHNATITKKHMQALGLSGQSITGDAENLPFKENTFHSVYCYGVLHHSPNTQKSIDQIHDVLKANGKFCVMLYHQGLAYYIIMIVRGILGLQFLKYRTPEKLFSKYYDNTPLSRAYSSRDMKKMFDKFSKVRIETYSFGGIKRNKKLKRFWFILGNKFLEQKIGSFIHAIGKK